MLTLQEEDHIRAEHLWKILDRLDGHYIGDLLTEKRICAIADALAAQRNHVLAELKK